MDDEFEVTGPGPCARCGKDPAEGFASTWNATDGEQWLCHGDDDESPTCYERGPLRTSTAFERPPGNIYVLPEGVEL